jgi:hypothetical protein
MIVSYQKLSHQLPAIKRQQPHAGSPESNLEVSSRPPSTRAWVFAATFSTVLLTPGIITMIDSNAITPEMTNATMRSEMV